jgi:hypothetical protein
MGDSRIQPKVARLLIRAAGLALLAFAIWFTFWVAVPIICFVSPRCHL